MMHDENDERLTQLLLRNAPPLRDPLFRVQVLERRERQRFRRSVLQLLGAVGAISMSLAVDVGMSGGMFEMARPAILGAAVAVAVSVYVPLLLRLWRASVRGYGGD
jgi:hypothetical protein